jgi:hypothetical protein
MFGLSMHIGKNDQKSKSEAMYVSPNFTEDLKTSSSSNITSRFIVKDGYIDFTDKFKYLGSIISNDLKDDSEIDARIKKATSQIGALKNFFKCKRISLATKFQIFQAIPINTVLWGCESWSMSDKICEKLKNFYHKNIRRILNINMHEVQSYKITNLQVRKMFCKAPCIIDIATKRQLLWIGKIVRMDPTTNLPRKLLVAWINKSRKIGRPQFTFKNTYENALKKIFTDIKKGPL